MTMRVTLLENKKIQFFPRYALQNVGKISKAVTFAILGYYPHRLNPSIVKQEYVK